MNPLTIFAQSSETASKACGSRGLLDFPAWYQYLDLGDDCSPVFDNINDLWLVIAALIEILTRAGAILAVGFIIWGGIRLVTSQGSPEGVKAARDTIMNAIIGLIIAIIATTAVSFIAGQF